MGYDFDKTHENILKSAGRHFMKDGFRSASIRRICNDAGVTNGAFYAHFQSKEDLFRSLVDPVLAGLYDVYGKENHHYGPIRSAEDILAAFGNTFASDQAVIHYIYAHQEAFLLLLKASGGTAYEGFPAMLVEMESQETERFFNACRPYIPKPENLTRDIVSKVSLLVVSAVFEGLLDGKTEEATLRDTQLVSEFCLAGLRQIWGL